MAKILIIEDHKPLAQMYATALHSANPIHQIWIAYTGEDGVEYAFRNPLDLVILDLMLPGVSGQEVAKTLTEAGIFPSTPFIIATALGEMARDFAKSLDAAAFLGKPFHVNVLVSTVEGILQAEGQGADTT